MDFLAPLFLQELACLGRTGENFGLFFFRKVVFSEVNGKIG